MSIEDRALIAQNCINRSLQAGLVYAEYAMKEASMVTGKTRAKCDAILRVKAGPNLLNPEKPHSVSSAEAVVELDSDYADYLEQLSDMVFRKNEAFAEAQAARLEAQLHIALVKAEAGVS